MFTCSHVFQDEFSSFGAYLIISACFEHYSCPLIYLHFVPRFGRAN